MGASAYNRGTKLVRRNADLDVRASVARAERTAFNEEQQRQSHRICSLERDLARARRCIAELRRSKEALLAEVRAELATSDAAIRTLTRLAFPYDLKEVA